MSVTYLCLVCVSVGPLPPHSLWSHAWSVCEKDNCAPAGNVSCTLIFQNVADTTYVCYMSIHTLLIFLVLLIIIHTLHIWYILIYILTFRDLYIHVCLSRKERTFTWKMGILLRRILVFLPINLATSVLIKQLRGDQSG